MMRRLFRGLFAGSLSHNTLRCWRFSRLIQPRYHNESLLLMFFIHSAVYQWKWASSDQAGRVSLGFSGKNCSSAGMKTEVFPFFWLFGSRRLLPLMSMYSCVDNLCVERSLLCSASVRFSCRTVALQALRLCRAIRMRG